MDRNSRMKLINKIQEKRKSKIIVYIAGDRKNMETNIATDIFPLFHKHLTKIGNQKN